MAVSTAESAYADALNRIEKETVRAANSIVIALLALMKKAKTLADGESFAREWLRGDSFLERSENAAERMANQILHEQRVMMRASTPSFANGRALERALRQTASFASVAASQSIARENARELRDFAEEAVEIISHAASEGVLSGKSRTEIDNRMRRAAEGFARTRSASVARKQTAVSATELARASAFAQGQRFYIWSTMRDERVRKSHRVMEGVVCQWAEPPNPELLAGMAGSRNYHPGNAPNCRCVALNVASAQDISFPAKFHISGQIIRIGSLNAFRSRFL